MKKESLKMKIDTKALKNDGINTGATIGGMMLGNAASQLIPIENPLIKNAIPLGAGAGVVVLGNAMKKDWVKGLGAGLATFGFLGLLNNVLRGENMPGTDDLPEGTAGIAGIGDNPTVAKITNLFIPNLGSANEITEFDFNDEGIEDADFEEMPYEEEEEPLGLIEDTDAQIFMNGIDEDGAVFLQGIDEDGAVFLQGYDDYANDPYEQDFKY